MSRPALYVYLDKAAGTALVRGKDARAYCEAAQPIAGSRFRWRPVWNGGWTIPAHAVPDLQAYARKLGQFIAVTEKPPPSREQSRDMACDRHPGQETLL